MTKPSKADKQAQEIADLTADLQRTRADFENFRKRMEAEKSQARHDGAAKATTELLPVIDTIERAIVHIPQDIAEHQWVKGVAGIVKQLDKTLSGLGVQRIDATAGVPFDPELHQAVQMDEDAEGDDEVIAEELQPGYILHGKPVRYAMVKVTRQ